MPDDISALTPRRAYRRIMDELVELAKNYGGGAILEQSQRWYNNDDEGNAFIASLTADQRALLVRLLRGERTGGIHDALAHLTWWIDCHGLELRRAGATIFHDDETCQGLHGDFVDRLAGDSDWPER